MQLQVHLICVSLVNNILLYWANFRSSNHCACACDFQWILVYMLHLRVWVPGFMLISILSDRPIILLSIMCSTTFSSRLVLILLNKTVSLYFAFFRLFLSIRIFFKFTENGKRQIYVLFNAIRTIHDEKIVEPNMESRKTDLFDKITKLAKIIKSWNPDPRKVRICTKNHMRMRKRLLLLKFAQNSKILVTKETPIKCTCNYIRFAFP